MMMMVVLIDDRPIHSSSIEAQLTWWQQQSTWWDDQWMMVRYAFHGSLYFRYDATIVRCCRSFVGADIDDDGFRRWCVVFDDRHSPLLEAEINEWMNEWMTTYISFLLLYVVPASATAGVVEDRFVFDTSSSNSSCRSCWAFFFAAAGACYHFDVFSTVVRTRGLSLFVRLLLSLSKNIS